MAETRNRKMAKRGGLAVRSNQIDRQGLLDAKVVNHYSTLGALPSSGSDGDLAYVSAGGRKYLYIYIAHDGDPYTVTGWYSIKIGAAA